VVPPEVVNICRPFSVNGARKVFAEVPPRVEHELTPLGDFLWPVMEPINAWAAEHVDEVLSLRKAHDAGFADDFDSPLKA
jgi:hypothetical protein